jgi:hypothetical protein
MKVYICSELGCVYRLGAASVLDFAPVMQSGVFDTDDFSPVEESLVGEEVVQFRGADLPLSSVYRIVETALSV